MDPHFLGMVSFSCRHTQREKDMELAKRLDPLLKKLMK
jgi:hypothetical protein